MSLIENELVVRERRINSRYINGHWIYDSATYTELWVNTQPIGGDETIYLPEANRDSEAIVIYSTNEILEDDIIRRDSENVAQVNTCTIGNVVDNISYAIGIDIEVHSYNSGVSATSLSIAAGIVSAITLSSSLVDAVDNLDGTYTVTSKIKGNAFDIVVDANQSQVEDVANVIKAFKIVRGRDWSAHSISHYEVYGYLLENPV